MANVAFRFGVMQSEDSAFMAAIAGGLPSSFWTAAWQFLRGVDQYPLGEVSFGPLPGLLAERPRALAQAHVRMEVRPALIASNGMRHSVTLFTPNGGTLRVLRETAGMPAEAMAELTVLEPLLDHWFSVFGLSQEERLAILQAIEASASWPIGNTRWVSSSALSRGSLGICVMKMEV